MDSKRKARVSRRSFLGGVAGSGAAFLVLPRHVLAGGGHSAPSDTHNVAGIGAGGRGGRDLRVVGRHANVVALCDVDSKRMAGTAKRFPGARKFTDYRRMLDEMGGAIDAVVVATPDHSHYHAAMCAMQRGKHVYVEKPLAHTVWEVRRLREAARKYDVVTQMGNQGHSGESTARIRDWILEDAIGPVREARVWKGGDHALRSKPSPAEPPDSLDYDLWLNRAPYTPFCPVFHPGSWRKWHPFGTGKSGDWGCHQLDPAFYSLDLKDPESVEAEVQGKWPVRNSYPTRFTLTWKYPARGERPPLRVKYYLLGDTPVQEVVPRPEHLEPDQSLRGTGSAIIGEDATILYGGHGGGGHIVPSEKMQEAGRPPQRSPRVRGHQASWVRACKGEGKALSHFDYAAPLAEMVLLGEVALRSRNKVIQWDSRNMRVTNDEEANRLVCGPEPRKGWEI